jgi:4-alpha-glucanotransferase
MNEQGDDPAKTADRVVMTALESLCAYYGIIGSFVDAHGDTRTATFKTQLALLKAMGVAATDEAGAGRVLRELELADAAQRLPPVHVHYQTDGSLEIQVNGDPSLPLTWHVELEDGTVRDGCLAPEECDDDRQVAPSSSPSRLLRIAAQLPCGYHTLVLEGSSDRCVLIITPGTCWLPPGEQPLWGVTLQLYLLRSATNWGIGDYTDLKRLVEVLARRGADVVGLNPLHAMFADDPEQASPYSPASRLLLNTLNIDVAALTDSAPCQAAVALMGTASFQRALAGCRDAGLLDYSGVVALKMPVLRAMFDCCDRTANSWQAFTEFRSQAGTAFERGCLFLALRSRFAADAESTGDWHSWPQAFRTPDSPAVQQFAEQRAEDVTFQAWLQFVADTQLRACRDAASGMAVGIYRDLAVGASRGGAETWANPGAVIDTVQVGAPPDIYNPQGQGWGLPPFNPRALRAEGYRSFIELLRANMRHAGGLRIDHVMALQQLYWVPDGHSPLEGAYVRYPLNDLVGILTLESQRAKCLVVGEDLGTVPAGFRERMQDAQILSYRVLFFEKDDQGYIAPEEYPRLAIAVAGSHDLPTLRAWWSGSDLQLKSQLGLYPTKEDAARAIHDRSADRASISHILSNHTSVPGTELDAEQFVEAAHELLANTRCLVRMLQIDDLTGEIDPVNVPSTSDEHPNWRRRLSVSLEQLVEDARFIAATAMLDRKRADGS